MRVRRSKAFGLAGRGGSGEGGDNLSNLALVVKSGLGNAQGVANAGDAGVPGAGRPIGAARGVGVERLQRERLQAPAGPPRSEALLQHPAPWRKDASGFSASRAHL